MQGDATIRLLGRCSWFGKRASTGNSIHRVDEEIYSLAAGVESCRKNEPDAIVGVVIEGRLLIDQRFWTNARGSKFWDTRGRRLYMHQRRNQRSSGHTTRIGVVLRRVPRELQKEVPQTRPAPHGVHGRANAARSLRPAVPRNLTPHPLPPSCVSKLQPYLHLRRLPTERHPVQFVVDFNKS